MGLSDLCLISNIMMGFNDSRPDITDMVDWAALKINYLLMIAAISVRPVRTLKSK